jgi:hypothetical protein
LTRGQTLILIIIITIITRFDIAMDDRVTTETHCALTATRVTIIIITIVTLFDSAPCMSITTYINTTGVSTAVA